MLHNTCYMVGSWCALLPHIIHATTISWICVIQRKIIFLWDEAWARSSHVSIMSSMRNCMQMLQLYSYISIAARICRTSVALLVASSCKGTFRIESQQDHSSYRTSQSHCNVSHFLWWHSLVTSHTPPTHPPTHHHQHYSKWIPPSLQKGLLYLGNMLVKFKKWLENFISYWTGSPMIITCAYIHYGRFLKIHEK